MVDTIWVEKYGRRAFAVTVTGRGRCRYCQESIVWARTENDKAIPLDLFDEEDDTTTCHIDTCSGERPDPEAESGPKRGYHHRHQPRGG